MGTHNKGIVEGSKDVSDTENIFTFTSTSAEGKVDVRSTLFGNFFGLEGQKSVDVSTFAFFEY